jgi:hypothetical protein
VANTQRRRGLLDNRERSRSVYGARQRRGRDAVADHDQIGTPPKAFRGRFHRIKSAKNWTETLKRASECS